jgi:putative transcriptional regulator
VTWPATDEQIEADAAADEENPPWTDEELARARRVPQVKLLRQGLALTQEAFAERYMIPLGTLRDWEQGVTKPDGAGKAYVRAIIGDPDAVAKALRKAPARDAAD